MRFAAIDFETANSARDSACSLACVLVENDKIIDSVEYLIRPPSSSFHFSWLHGITYSDVCKEPFFDVIYERITPLIQDVQFVAAHNAVFDRSVLNACCKRYALQSLTKPFLCTVKLARSLWRIFPTKLSDVCARLNFELNHHQALSDALACANIVIAARKQVEVLDPYYL